MTEILRFEMNVPAEVALKYAGPGKSIEGRYGNRVMYTLADNRVMYVAPIVASRISDLGIRPGEVFQVCKQEKRQGQRKLIEWQVQRLASEPGTQLEQELRESIAVAQAARAAAPPSDAHGEPNESTPIAPPECEPATPAILAAISPGTPISNGIPNGTISSAAEDVVSNAAPSIVQLENALQPAITTPGETAAQLVDAPKPPAPGTPAPTPTIVPIANGGARASASSTPKNGNSPSPPVVTKLEYALKTAISAAHNAEKFGAELGYTVRFDADAIKSMAITVLINMSEAGRR